MAQPFQVFQVALMRWCWSGLCGVLDFCPYYCGIGAKEAFGCDIVDGHYKACLYTRIKISVINREWKFQVGPSFGTSASDELWAARYILKRITDIAVVVV